MLHKNYKIEEFSVSDIDGFIAKRLRPRLPYSLPLLRRCQFNARNKEAAPNAEIWAAEAVGMTDEDDTFLAAHVDLSNAGQTQVWTFASWETEFSRVEGCSETIRASANLPVYEALFGALRERIRTYHIPRLDKTPPQQWQRLKDAGKRVSEPYSRSKVLFGTAAETLWPHLETTAEQTVSRTDMSYFKYIIASTKSATDVLAEPPNGFHFEPMRKQHLQTMIDRTNIPRSMETIQQLPSIALYDQKDIPVAWGLLSKDASIGSLHTESDHRRKGLAELTARRLMAEQVKLFDNDPIEAVDTEAVIWSHADVSDENIPSQRVMEKVGGKKMWRCAWIEVDIGEKR